MAPALASYFPLLARYNRIANERLYEACSRLTAEEYKVERSGSFGSIHKLLNHLLLGDRIWMERFAGRHTDTPPLGTVLHAEFAPLREAREEMDRLIESFFNKVDESFFAGSFSYINNQGKPYVESALVAAGHFFNHQTHHRGQVHVMLSQTAVHPPSLDMHRILNP
jgi:uncharacterized damage-inducible protein DinB